MERHTLLDFAVSATSHRGDSVLSQLARLHGLVVPGRALSGRGILAALAAQLKVRQRKLLVRCYHVDSDVSGLCHRFWLHCNDDIMI